jgi:hypothetical protein
VYQREHEAAWLGAFGEIKPMKRSVPAVLLTLAMTARTGIEAYSADLVALSPQTWDRYAPQGKEVDAIYGDFALVNDQIVAVIAHPRRGRNANMTVRDVGGCLIDLTRRDSQNDQLSAFYPGAHLRDLKFAGVEVVAPRIYEVDEIDRLFVQARRVSLRLVAAPREKEPDIEVLYTMEDGWPEIVVDTRFTNTRAVPIEFELVDSFRLDGAFEFSAPGVSDLFWAYDKHFGQAYGLYVDDHTIQSAVSWERQLRYRDQAGKVAVRLEPGMSYRLFRVVTPGANLFEVQRNIARQRSRASWTEDLEVRDPTGQPVDAADVVLEQAGKRTAWGRTDLHGKIAITTDGDPGTLTINAPGRGTKTVSLGAGPLSPLKVELPVAGWVTAIISDSEGKPVPCKVQFLGRNGTASPDFGPDSGEHAVKNVYYSENGRFRQVLDPGNYDVIVSHGPEYDAVFTRIEIVRGKDTVLEAKLVRSVKTDGWISADFHSHSSPSGDNTSSQLGRVLNLLCEHIEFAPCTEHNRLSTYDSQLKRLGAEALLATCVGIELTGNPLPLNHQNAFPLVLRPNTQDGGGPAPDADPAIQIERLALWDQNSDKLVQVNHPDIGWMFFDRNGDGNPDSGFSGMFGKIDVIEVHPPQWIFAGPTMTFEGKAVNIPIRNWLQLLNQGRRIPGVVNTDAHYNFHGSGWLRNYIRSPTDDPAQIKTLDVVHAAERGNLVMSTGPFLEVTMTAHQATASPGDNLAVSGGRANLKVRVQCPNWFDVDRVQVFINGRPDSALNFTRDATPDRFSAATVKFDQEIPLALSADAHVIVAAIGEHSKLGPAMGPDHAADLPVAVSNPIFVDVDGGGFKANGDALGKLPVKAAND